MMTAFDARFIELMNGALMVIDLWLTVAFAFYSASRYLANGRRGFFREESLSALAVALFWFGGFLNRGGLWLGRHLATRGFDIRGYDDYIGGVAAVGAITCLVGAVLYLRLITRRENNWPWLASGF